MQNIMMKLAAVLFVVLALGADDGGCCGGKSCFDGKSGPPPDLSEPPPSACVLLYRAIYRSTTCAEMSFAYETALRSEIGRKAVNQLIPYTNCLLLNGCAAVVCTNANGVSATLAANCAGLGDTPASFCYSYWNACQNGDR